MARPRGSKNKAKKFEPTDQDRTDVCAMITDNNFMAPIARLMGLTEVKFKKVFAYEIKFGKDMAVSNVKKALYKKAIEEKNVTAQLGFLNNYDDNVKNNVSDDDEDINNNNNDPSMLRVDMAMVVAVSMAMAMTVQS